jgi:hypothetical protein
LDGLVGACRAIPGVSDQLQDLSEYARRAIVHAFIESGQEAPPAAQRYIESGREVIQAGRHDFNHPGRTVDSSTDRQVVSVGPYIASRGTPSSHPRYQEANGKLGEPRIPVIPIMLNSTAGTQQMQYTHANYDGYQNLHERQINQSSMGQANIGPITTTSQVQVNPENNRSDMLADVAQTPYYQTGPFQHPFRDTGSDMGATNQQMCDQSMRPQWPADVATGWSQGPADQTGEFNNTSVETLNRFERDEAMTGDNPLQWQEHEFYAPRFYDELYVGV